MDFGAPQNPQKEVNLDFRAPLPPLPQNAQKWGDLDFRTLPNPQKWVNLEFRTLSFFVPKCSEIGKFGFERPPPSPPPLPPPNVHKWGDLDFRSLQNAQEWVNSDFRVPSFLEKLKNG